MARCDKCHLAKTSNHIRIDGRGSETPSILIVGEAPGQDEDTEGTCFIGPAGKLLESMIQEARIPPDAYRLTNMVRCTPWEGTYSSPRDKRKEWRRPIRQPEEDEITACFPYLAQEIVKYKPKIVVILGNVTAGKILEMKQITKIRGSLHDHTFTHNGEGHITKVMPIIHPSAILRSNNKTYYSNIVNDLSIARKMAFGEKEVKRETDYRFINTPVDLDLYTGQVLADHKAGTCPFIAVDLETNNSLNPFDDTGKILTIQISTGPGKAVLIPVDRNGSGFVGEIDRQVLITCLKRLLDVVPVVGHNYRFDFKFLYTKLGIFTKNVFFDTLLAHHCLFMNIRPNDLEYEVATYLGHGGYKRKFKEYATVEAVPDDVILEYGCSDADFTYQLVAVLSKMLEDAGLKAVFDQLYMFAWEPVVMMEINGFSYDKAKSAELQIKYKGVMDETMAAIKASPVHKKFAEVLEHGKHMTKALKAIKKKDLNECSVEEVGKLFADTRALVKGDSVLNIASSPQMKCLVYEVMRLEDPGINRETECSTDKDTMPALMAQCDKKGLKDELEILKLIGKWRVADKMQTGFLEKYDDVSKPGPYGKVYLRGSINQHGTRTGRLSIQEPPLQAIPHDSAVKMVFNSRYGPGGFLVSADYSQIEVRIFASECGDKDMLQVFLDDKDFHRMMASRLYEIPEDQVTKEQRYMAKSVTFATLYGGTADTIASDEAQKDSKDSYEIRAHKGQQLLDAFARMFPGARLYVQRRHEEVKKGFIHGMTGRRHPIPEALSIKKMDIEAAERYSVDYGIQGSASDIALQSLARTYRRILGMKSVIACAIHDAIVVDVAPTELFTIMSIMKSEMTDGAHYHAPWMKAPMKVDFSVGTRYGTALDVSFTDNVDLVKVKGDEQSFAEFMQQVEPGGYKLSDIQYNDNTYKAMLSVNI